MSLLSSLFPPEALITPNAAPVRPLSSAEDIERIALMYNSNRYCMDGWNKRVLINENIDEATTLEWSRERAQETAAECVSGKMLGMFAPDGALWALGTVQPGKQAGTTKIDFQFCNLGDISLNYREFTTNKKDSFTLERSFDNALPQLAQQTLQGINTPIHATISPVHKNGTPFTNSLTPREKLTTLLIAQYKFQLAALPCDNSPCVELSRR